jgi:hypothetical protein
VYTPPSIASDDTRPGAATDVDLGLLDELSTGLAQVQTALERLDDGTYGSCEHCGTAIDDDVLRESPTATLCGAHLRFGDPGALVIPEIQVDLDAPESTEVQVVTLVSDDEGEFEEPEA